MKTTPKHLMMAAVGMMFLFASVGAQAQGVSLKVKYYVPQFYVDHLVFYDDEGAPIYYENDTPYTVPATYDGYKDLVAHHRKHRDHYHRWFKERGHKNLHYRRPVATSYYRPLFYNDYPVFFDRRGMPTYYINGRVHMVPTSYGGYGALVRNYQLKKANYLRWYREAGHLLRWYRRPIQTAGYSPRYFDGYVVYYDDGGLPYYYNAKRRVPIPRTDRRYDGYVSHYRTHRSGYVKWNGKVGRNYRDYRREDSYRKRVVNKRAPRAKRGRADMRDYEQRRARTSRGERNPGRRVDTTRPESPRRDSSRLFRSR